MIYYVRCTVVSAYTLVHLRVKKYVSFTWVMSWLLHNTSKCCFLAINRCGQMMMTMIWSLLTCDCRIVFTVCRLRDGIYNVLSISSLGNQYLQTNKPWDLLKGSDNDRSVASASTEQWHLSVKNSWQTLVKLSSKLKQVECQRHKHRLQNEDCKHGRHWARIISNSLQNCPVVPVVMTKLLNESAHTAARC